MTTLELTTSRVIKAPRERVFAAWTSAKWLTQWWGPGPVTCPEAEVDLRIGGAYRIANRDEDGSITWISGTFSEVEPPQKLVYDWSVSTIKDLTTLVTVEFDDHPDGTMLTLTHSRFVEEPVRDMHGMGWEGCLNGLEAFFEANPELP